MKAETLWASLPLPFGPSLALRRGRHHRAHCTSVFRTSVLSVTEVISSPTQTTSGQAQDSIVTPTAAYTMPTPYTDELRLAVRAVHAASILTKSVLRSLQNSISAETKSDDSPVTIADFAAQALIISAVHAVYPEDSFIGEESAEALRKNDALAERVWELVQRAREVEMQKAEKSSHVQTHDGDTSGAALAFPASKEDMLRVIDMGSTDQTRNGRVWVMDPVDGTATFMTNNQYAVCLCLLTDGMQEVAVIGCPNLRFDVQGPLGQRIQEDHVDEAEFGVMLSAVKGQGTFVRSMHATGVGDARSVKLEPTSKEHSALDFVETTVGKTSLLQSEHRAVAEELGARWPGTVLWSQQMKYAALTLGATDVMVRIPKDQSRYSYIWDHAGGQLLFQEAGGIVKDLNGSDIDFRHGRKLLGTVNLGMLATSPSAFDGVMQAMKTVLEKRSQ